MTNGECPVLQWPAAAKVPPLAGGEVHVWRAALDVSPPELESFHNLLDGPERERAERFHRDEDRRRFIAAHGLVRTLLGRYLDAPPERLQFLAGPWGKPALRRGAEMQDIRFSLSHSGHLALFAFAHGREVGVDIECIQPDFHWEPIAKRFFLPGEFAALSALPEAARGDAFFSFWTCKEACMKATGRGFSLPPDRFEIFWKPDHTPTVSDFPSPAQTARRWALRSLPLGPRRAAAIAAEGDSWNLRFWQWAAAER
jgi:4'-phosphopantetheinyl transferase